MILTDNDYITYITELGQQQTIKGGVKVGRYFKAKELACPTSKILKCDNTDGVDFILRLDDLRSRVRQPFRVITCCRHPKDYNPLEGPSKHLHLIDNPREGWKGCIAVEISVDGWPEEVFKRCVGIAACLGWSIGRNEMLDKGVASGTMTLDRRIDIGLGQVEYNYE